jgi:hypothetical protein
MPQADSWSWFRIPDRSDFFMEIHDLFDAYLGPRFLSSVRVDLSDTATGEVNQPSFQRMGGILPKSLSSFDLTMSLSLGKAVVLGFERGPFTLCTLVRAIGRRFRFSSSRG